MKTLGIIAASLLAIIAVAVLAYKTAYPTYSHRYRLTIAIEIDGQTYTGSSVIEARWVGQPTLGSASPFIPKVRGQGALVDLGSRGAIVAALHPPSYRDGSVGADILAIRAFHITGGFDAYRLITLQRGRRDLDRGNMPLLIWFSDISDPRTARPITADSFPDLFGPNARLAAAYVEMTGEQPRVDLDQRLSWYTALAAKQKAGLVGQPGHFYLVYNMLVGEDS